MIPQAELVTIGVPRPSFSVIYKWIESTNVICQTKTSQRREIWNNYTAQRVITSWWASSKLNSDPIQAMAKCGRMGSERTLSRTSFAATYETNSRYFNYHSKPKFTISRIVDFPLTCRERLRERAEASLGRERI